MQRTGHKRATAKSVKKTTTTPTSTLKRKKSSAAKPRRNKTATTVHFGNKTPITTTTHSSFSSQRKRDNDSDDSTDSSEPDQPSYSDDAEQDERGPLMPELYVLSLQLDQKRPSFYKDKRHQKDYLSSISQRMLDKNGLFLRTSPPLLHVMPSYYQHLKLDDRVMYFQKGEVEVFVAPISQPDEISRNHAMVDSLLDDKKLKFRWDNVVIPLSAKPQNYSAYHNPLQRMTTRDIKYDIFDPENVPKPPKIVSGAYSVVETPQYAAYQAYEADYDITLSGRLEFVSINNWKFKAIQMPTRQRAEVSLLAGSGVDNATLLGAAPMNILPHTPSTNLLAELTFNFEPALVATAAIRSSVEEQQAEYDNELKAYKQALEAEGDKSNITKPRTRRVLAFIDTAQLRHFENTYELMPAIKPQEWSYLKRGFEEWYRESNKPTFGEMLSSSLENLGNSDSDDSDDSVSSESSEPEDTKANEKDSKGKKSETRQASTSTSVLAEPGIKPSKEIAQARLVRLQTVSKSQPQALSAPMVGIHRLFTAIYGPAADLNTSSCGRCQFDIDQFGLYMPRCSSPTLMSKMGLSKPVKCSDPFDYHFNPEAMRFPPFDSDHLLGENITPNLFKQWMAMRHGLVKLEKQANREGRQLYLDDILKVQNSLEQILQGNLKKFPTPHVRESDATWTPEKQAMADSDFLRGARSNMGDDDDSDESEEDDKKGKDGEEKGSGKKGDEQGDAQAQAATTKAAPAETVESLHGQPPLEDKGFNIIGKFQAMVDESAQTTMKEVIQTTEAELSKTKHELQNPHLTPEQRTELSEKLNAGTQMLKRAKDAYTTLTGEVLEAKKEENHDYAHHHVQTVHHTESQPREVSQEFSVSMSQTPIDNLKVAKKPVFKNEFRNITEAEVVLEPVVAAAVEEPVNAAPAASAAPKYTGSNEFRKVTENAAVKDEKKD